MNKPKRMHVGVVLLISKHLVYARERFIPQFFCLQISLLLLWHLEKVMKMGLPMSVLQGMFWYWYTGFVLVRFYLILKQVLRNDLLNILITLSCNTISYSYVLIPVSMLANEISRKSTKQIKH